MSDNEAISREIVRDLAEGWVMVPREPTTEMLAAGNKARGNTGSLNGDRNSEATYCAMLSASPKAPPVRSDDEIATTHPGFTITCDKCGSRRVITENSMGFSAESGGWGSLDLTCLDCGNSTPLVEA